MRNYLHTSKAISNVDINEFFESENWRYLLSLLLVHKSTVAKMNGIDCVLHHACMFRPPLYIIKRLFQVSPNAAFEKDDKDRFALHIACEHGCCPKVINYLLQKNPDAAKKPDEKYQTPVHLACKSYVTKCDKDWNTANMNLVKVVEELINVAPLSASREDSQGKTVLEYAIESNLSLFVIRFLERRYKCNKKMLLHESVDLENHLCRVRLQLTDIPHEMHQSSLRNKRSTKSSQISPSLCVAGSHRGANNVLYQI